MMSQWLSSHIPSETVLSNITEETEIQDCMSNSEQKREDASNIIVIGIT